MQKPFAVSEDQALDAAFSDKGARKNESKGVVQLMTMLIEDLQDEIKNEGKAEEETQIEYESEMDKATKLKGELEDLDLAATELKKNGKFKLGGVLNTKLKKKPARAARKGVNPSTKEPCVFKAKPASKTVRVLPMKKLKGAIN